MLVSLYENADPEAGISNINKADFKPLACGDDRRFGTANQPGDKHNCRERRHCPSGHAPAAFLDIVIHSENETPFSSYR